MLPILIHQIKLSNIDLSQIIVISFDKYVIKECKVIEPNLVSLWLNDFDEDFDIELITSTLIDIKADGISSNNTATENYHQQLLHWESLIILDGVLIT